MSDTEQPSTEPVPAPDGPHEWHRVLDTDALPSGRVTTVSVGRRTLAVTNVDGTFGAMDNHCPHQGGPLGEGTIEKGWLRCPWHGYDYSPCNGVPPEGFDDAPEAYASEVREDGVYVALPPEPEHQRTVSDVMVETMTNWGVDSVFGMVGHSNLGLADAMRRAEERGDLRYFGIRHEGAAAFAATAYGKLTGRLAACFAIAGPGSTNMLTGLYDAKVDRAPVLALCGQVPSKTKGRGAFQDMDLASAFDDVSQFGEVVLAGADHAELMTVACKTAIVDKNVSTLIFPDEVQVDRSEQAASGPAGRTASREIVPPQQDVDAAIEKIRNAERPVIVVGQGARADMTEVIELAELIGAPVITTFKAKGAISDRHPLGCGVLGRSGTPVASWLINESDLVVALGASFSNHTGIAPYKPIVQVDHDPMAIGRNHPVELGLQGAVAPTTRLLAAGLDGERKCIDQREIVAERWALWRAEKASRRTDDQSNGMETASIFEELARHVPDDAVICVDVGNNTYSFGRYFEVANQDILMSGYLGSIGFSLPAAMGAWAAVGDSRKIVSVSGDGGFGQYAMEVTTAVKYGMNITHVLLNNSELGKISKEQRAGEFDVWQTSLHNPSFAEFAELCGAHGERVTDRSQLDAAMTAALAHDGPSIVEVITNPLMI